MTQAELITVIMVKLVEQGRVSKSFADGYSVKSSRKNDLLAIEFNDGSIPGVST